MPDRIPNPWRAVPQQVTPNRDGQRWRATIVSEDGHPVVESPYWNGAADANIRHIVACVNACLGKTTEELEAWVELNFPGLKESQND